MTNKEYKNEKKIKFFIITNTNIPLIATKESDGTPMKETYNLKYYKDNKRCEYHIDYLQVLLNKYFRNTSLNKYIGETNNEKTEEIIKELVANNNVIFTNITLYESINYKINKQENGRLYINENISKEQLKILKENKYLFNSFDNIEIFKYNNEQFKKIDIKTRRLTK